MQSFYRRGGSPIDANEWDSPIPKDFSTCGPFSDELKAGVEHPAGVWFDEPVRELPFRATNLKVVYTLLHLKNSDRAIRHAGPTIEGSYDASNGPNSAPHHASRAAAHRRDAPMCNWFFEMAARVEPRPSAYLRRRWLEARNGCTV
jgi:hypothetical protein